MVDVNKFSSKALAESFNISVFDLDNIELGQMRKFSVTFFNNTRGKLGGVNRWIAEFIDNVGERADVVVMTVGNDDALNPIYFVLQIINVGKIVVDSGLVTFRKAKAGVNDQNFILILKHVHIAADFAKSAKRNNAQ